ncbi:MAG TPA: hypothetical protein VIP06_02840 [Nocardioides sp.]
MFNTGSPVIKSPLIAALERMIQVLTDHPELDQTISSLDIYGRRAVTLAGSITVHSRGKQAELDQWVDAIGGLVTTEPRVPAEGSGVSWLASANSADGTIHVLVTTDRPKA